MQYDVSQALLVFGACSFVLINVGQFANMGPTIRGYKRKFGSSARESFRDLNEYRKNTFPVAYYLTWPAKKLAEQIYF